MLVQCTGPSGIMSIRDVFREIRERYGVCGRLLEVPEYMLYIRGGLSDVCHMCALLSQAVYFMMVYMLGIVGGSCVWYRMPRIYSDGDIKRILGDIDIDIDTDLE